MKLQLTILLGTTKVRGRGEEEEGGGKGGGEEGEGGGRGAGRKGRGSKGRGEGEGGVGRVLEHLFVLTAVLICYNSWWGGAGVN